MKETSFSISIQASKAQVWKVLWDDESFRDWASLIDEGTFKKGELVEGNEMEFISAVNGYGVTSKVEKLVLEEYVLFRHRADTQGAGLKEREQEWTGGKESYSLSERNGVTELVLTMDLPPEQQETFAESVPKALHRIKQLAEGM